MINCFIYLFTTKNTYLIATIFLRLKLIYILDTFFFLSFALSMSGCQPGTHCRKRIISHFCFFRKYCRLVDRREQKIWSSSFFGGNKTNMKELWSHLSKVRLINVIYFGTVQIKEDNYIIQWIDCEFLNSFRIIYSFITYRVARARREECPRAVTAVRVRGACAGGGQDGAGGRGQRRRGRPGRRRGRHLWLSVWVLSRMTLLPLVTV